MKKIFNIFAAVLLLCVLASCKGFLDEHVPQAALNEDQVKDPENAEHLVVAAYAIFTSAGILTYALTMPTKVATAPMTEMCSINWKYNKECLPQTGTSTICGYASIIAYHV